MVFVNASGVGMSSRKTSPAACFAAAAAAADVDDDDVLPMRALVADHCRSTSREWPSRK
jgi:hypothetical protein